MSVSESQIPQSAEEKTPEDVDAPQAGEHLPPIKPPTAGFVLQLFFIPMIIVAIIVMVWLMFSWLAHMGSNPQDLVDGILKANAKSWQDAERLAEMLRDPSQQSLKKDTALARKLSEALGKLLDAKHSDENTVNLRVYLCKVLGEFEVPDGYPVLLRAATQQNHDADIDVRRSALESIALLARTNRQRFQSDEKLMGVLRDAVFTRGGGDKKTRRREAKLRERAAFALGVIGGRPALDVLSQVLTDPQPNPRYNATTGLARHGDSRAIPMLIEMLDADNEFADVGEAKEPAQQWKRLTVLNNGIQATRLFIEQNSAADRSGLKLALQKLIESDMPKLKSSLHRSLRMKAKEVMILMKS